MKTGKFIKYCCLTVAALLITAMLSIGSFIYVSKYKISDIDASFSDDGQYELFYQSVGEPDWPFGHSHARLVLKQKGKTVTKYKLDVANDGGILSPDSWRVYWKEHSVEIIISGAEQQDVLYMLYFDGRTAQKILAAKYGK